MKKQLYGTIIEYCLVYLLFAAAIGVIFTIEDLLMKVLTLAVLGTIYFVWVVWHHVGDHKGLHWHVVLEYLAVFILVVWILLAIQ